MIKVQLDLNIILPVIAFVFVYNEIKSMRQELHTLGLLDSDKLEIEKKAEKRKKDNKKGDNYHVRK